MKKGLIKKIFAATLVGVMALSFVGCGSKEEKNDLETIKEKGKVVVGMSADYAPYEFHAMIDGKDKVVGFDVNLANEIAKDMGVKLEIKEMEFDPLIGALKAGQIDMIISGMNPDEKRKKQIDFSDIYYEAKHGVLVKKENLDKFKKVDDLNGKKIGAQLGSTQQEIAEKTVKDADVQLLANVNNLILELKTDKVNALIIEEPVAKMAMETNPELALSEITFKDTSGGNAVGMRKGQDDLVKQVNKTIKRLKDSGDLDKFIIDANNIAAENQSN
ncbi:transporter substrate-binding domain-containing protein [uncultured Clostridium sp.]|uniref:transporter substrate-binding domain-containing protein n=1 Tax=uncultured Clostridium sp. TaxID=59620 RepID=UPI0025CD7555|nr:transporter substrate-binding domain-containing protein [uncultured Clostridium sp.]